MARLNMVWRTPFEGEDVHLLRGVPSFAIEELVRFMDGTDVLDVATARQRGLEAIDFKPRLRIGGPTGGVYTALGLEVGAATGRIVAEPGSPDPRIEQFFLDIEARITGSAAPVQASLLVWLHDHIEAAWMTPSPITVPRGHGTQRSPRRPTILARFLDAVIGDVTGHPGVELLPAPPLEADPVEMQISAPATAPLGARVPVTAILPAGLLGLEARGEALVGPAWEELPAEQRTVAGLGFATATASDAGRASANVLVLADGIPDAGEQLALAQGLATSLRRMRPYSWTYDRILLWGLPLASRQTGGTLRWMADTEDGRPLPVGRAVAPPATGPWTVENLLHVVGPALPVPAGGWPALPDQIDRWSIMLPFDAADLAGKIDEATYSSWRARTVDRLPLNERDTALAVVQGTRAATHAPPGARGGGVWRSLFFGPGRMSRSELNRLLGLLLDRTGAPMGDRWTSGADRRLVVVLSGGHEDTGNYLPGNELVIMAVERSGEAPRVTTRVDERGSDVSGAQWPIGPAETAAANRLRGRFAHELGHALGLGDEYGGEHVLPDSQLNTAVTYANLQAEAGPAGLSDGTVLRGDRLRWNHLRVARAFLLRDDFPPITEVLEESGDPPREVDGRLAYRLALQQTGQLTRALDEGFDLADGTHPVLFLRTRRSLNTTLDAYDVSPPVELIRPDANFDVVFVRERVAGALESFRALVERDLDRNLATLLLAPVPKAVEADGFARLLPKLVRDHLTASGRPLDAPSPAVLDAWTCPARSNDSSWPKMRNRPPLRKGKPFFAARRVPAVWTGGMVFDCGIFHPTSHSIMRGDTARALFQPGEHDVFVPELDVPLPATGEPGEFDAVASYLLIDRLDPASHHFLERFIALRDPD